MWRTWWPVVSTNVVPGFCWRLIQAVAWNWSRTDHYMNQCWVNSSRPRQNGLHFADDIFKCIFFNENVWIPLKISLTFVPKDQINNIPALVQIMAWCRSGDKPFSEPMMVSFLTHICVTRPQWVNTLRQRQDGRHFPNNILKRIFFNENL